MDKKKHLVVICGQYYPTPSPTAICAERYALLFKDEFDIDFVSQSDNGDEEDVELPSGIVAHTLSCKRLSIENKTHGLFSRMMHTLGSLLLLSNLLGNQKWFRKAACKKLEVINRKNPVDIVFSICSPLAAVWAGIDFKKKHPHVCLCSYTVDPYATPDRIKPLFYTRSAMLRFERSALSSVDYCLLSEEVYKTRNDIRDGIVCRALPYLIPPFSEQVIDVHSRLSGAHPLRCVYAGSFYESIRNPEYLLNVFSRISKETAELHLYSKGCENIILRHSQDQSIVPHQMVTQSELQTVYQKADLLIGVGNSVSDFLPSKTFEYIAQRKPIVYFNHGSIGNDVLTHYPCALQLSDADSVEESVGKLLDFLVNLFNPLVDKELLMIIYKKNSPESIKGILSNVFLNDEK